MEKQSDIQKLEKEILAKEEQILGEVRREEGEIKNMNRKIMMLAAALVLVVGGAIGAFAYLGVANGRVYIENAQITAPTIDLAPHTAGVLQEVDVQEGDIIMPNTVVARVGTELIKSKVGGVVITVNNNIGKIFNPGQAVVSMIDPTQLRTVGKLAEDKGLASVQVGQRAIFTVDAFGSKTFTGVVDEIRPSASSPDVVFNISGQRQENDFDVKVRFDSSAYPELKNGMSAKIWVYKN